LLDARPPCSSPTTTRCSAKPCAAWPALLPGAASARRKRGRAVRHGRCEPDADLLLLDLNMPGTQGFSALVHLRAAHPQLPVAMVSAREEPAVMRRALDHGAMGFIPKSSDAATLATALQQVLDGERWVPDAALKAAPIADDERAIAARVRELTPQQFRVLQMLGAGLLNKQIGYELGVSEATIKAHMSAILRKLGANNRTQACCSPASWRWIRRGWWRKASDGCFRPRLCENSPVAGKIQAPVDWCSA
jgi:DNA-binding NarL/FixJ family response regulator